MADPRFYAKNTRGPASLPDDWALRRELGLLDNRVTIIETSPPGAGLEWGVKTADFTFAADEAWIMEATGAAATADLPGTVAAGDYFILHNSTASTQQVDLDPMSGHTIRGPCGNAVGGTDTIKLLPGETIYVVAVTSALLEIV